MGPGSLALAADRCGLVDDCGNENVVSTKATLPCVVVVDDWLSQLWDLSPAWHD